MSSVGQKERKTQNQVIKLFTDTLKYDYLGDWHEQTENKNVEETLLRAFLKEKQKYTEEEINKTLYQFLKVVGDQSRSLYDINKDVYQMLRYGVKARLDTGENTETFWLIDWKHPEHNHFAVAEEVTILGENTKRPDVVIYVNGIALGVLELKRSTVSVSEGIRQNLDNQKSVFIKPFFTTMQLVMAGNDTQGLRYATIETPEKYYLTWKEPSEMENPLHRSLSQLCEKNRFLEIIHDFIVFDAGVKKLCRHNQYFGVRAAHDFVRRREGGIIWHTQGSGKSFIMVWLAKWLREHQKDARVLIITDRTELDEQIERVYKGVNEEIYRTSSGADLIAKLNAAKPWLLCSLVHKFVGRDDPDVEGYIKELRKSLPPGFTPKGNIFVFVDECHRTQSGVLHDAMKELLPDALFIGFTGTPLLKKDKKTSLETFGRYIHTYKYDEAVADKVVLDLRYEARDIDQNITSQKKVDQWFELKTKGLNDVARAQLKKRWGTMQTIFSSQSRLEMIVADILLDMETKDRLKSGRGNAMVVSGSIYQACRLFEMFSKTDLAGKCAIVTSYSPSASQIKGEESGEGETEKLVKYEIYQKMLGDYFSLPPNEAVNKVEQFEKEVKKKFIHEPGQMKLLIVVDKLLTGFDAPPATYLYIDKQMRDHGLFQAICRVNRLDGDDKDYGYIVDYKDLFKSLERSINDYTSEAFDGYDKSDVEGLLTNRLEKAKEELEQARETVKALVEPVELPRDTAAHLHYFCTKDTSKKEQLKENEPKRLTLYKAVSTLLRAYANVANEMEAAGYSSDETAKIKKEVEHFENVRKEVKLGSGDYVDLKMYEPAMRHLIDTYIRAEESEKISAFDDLTLIQLIVERGADAIDQLPRGIRENKEATAETIENNLRRVIIDKQPINPKYYEKMSALLDALIKERKQQALEYAKYLKKIVELTKGIENPAADSYPTSLNSTAKRALYDNLEKNEQRALAVHEAIVTSKEDEWRAHPIKLKKVRYAIRNVLSDEELTEYILGIVKNQPEY